MSPPPLERELDLQTSNHRELPESLWQELGSVLALLVLIICGIPKQYLGPSWLLAFEYLSVFLHLYLSIFISEAKHLLGNISQGHLKLDSMLYLSQQVALPE